MLEWHEYIGQLLSRESSFDGVSLSLDSNKPVGVPPIIKASILMLDRMLECHGIFNMFVFPERVQSIFIFTLIKLLHNIAEGKIERAYDPEAFKPGEKLKFGKAVVEFVEIEEREGKKYMKIRLADLIDSAPVEFFPLFQKTTTERKISMYKHFAEAKKKAKKIIPVSKTEGNYLKMLSDYKTHMDSSIIYMTSIINTKELIASCKLCGQRVSDLILVGQVDYEGNVRNIGSGQLGGIPAIVLASDLYAIVAAAENGHPIQSLIIDASNSGAILSQMDALDELMRRGVPITCVTDIVNSFDLQPLHARNFNIWRWDESSITAKMYNVTALLSDHKIKCCARRKVEYLVSDGKEISTAIRKLSVHKNGFKDQSASMIKLFETLYTLTFKALRETVPFNDLDLEQGSLALDECERILAAERNYIETGTFDDYCLVIYSLKRVFTKGYLLPKQDALGELLCLEAYESVCIVVPERTEKRMVQDFWKIWCYEKHITTKVYVLHPAEYYSTVSEQFSATIVVGWLKRAIMRKILYSFITEFYCVLLYDYEKRWKNYDTARWNAALDITQNRRIISRSFSTDQIHISTSKLTGFLPEVEGIPETDEFAEIEVILRESKYRHYVGNGSQKSESEFVQAIPINFIGGYLAFYRTGNKVISASNIIMNDSDKIDNVLPGDLRVGDFIVVREADRDLIKEMADIILEQSGKSDLRDLATKWKDAIQIEKLFYTPEEIYQQLQKIGCTRGYPTVRGWLMDDDVIAPQSKEDLEYIAAFTNNAVLRESLDQIFDAAQTVRTAHVQAGRVLSHQLRSRIVDSLREYGVIDPFNIWKPIEMQIEGIGMVRILKIIDIGSPVMVDIAITKRLIDE